MGESMKKSVPVQFIVSALFAAALLAGCGGGSGKSPSFTGGGTGGTGTGGAGTGGTAAVKSVSLIASAPSLPSGASTSTSPGAITLTAIVKDAGNNLLSSIPVTISSAKKSGTTCGSGGAVTAAANTGSDGTTKSTLSTAGDPVNQIITVTAIAGGVSSQIDIPVTGTSLSLTGPTAVSSNGTVQYTVKLVDSSNNPIGNQAVSLADTSGNPIAPASKMTAPDGTATFSYTGTTGGTDTLSATGGCAAPSNLSIQVSDKQLTFTAPANNTSIVVGAPAGQGITINLKQNGLNFALQTVNFNTTRGNFSACPGPAAQPINTTLTTTAQTDISGNATVCLSQPSAAGAVGGATVTVSYGTAPNTVSTTLPVTFVSTTVGKISVQAQPTTVPTKSTSAVIAVVRDANDNPVQGKQVDFSVTGDPGASFPANAVTDNQGAATITYTAGAAQTATDGVELSATANGTAFTSKVKLTVVSQGLSLSLGTSNVLDGSDATQYKLPYTARVTNAAGNPVPNATVTFSIISGAYAKGQYAADNKTRNQSAVCSNEDTNLNGSLDAGEDTNGDNQLTPGQVATVAGSGVTGADGTVTVNVNYFKNQATWSSVILRATTTVSGNQGSQSVAFILPVLASDLGSTTVPPPNAASPFGQSNSCNNAL